ncbi:MAG: tRNA (adenosine(37)-N6)-dimethylallyltransferase MiaA [Ignavibacteriales bacterium]|nr:tRNA (adenosine(37)-N6)-dimethylallyltransferase MiaA [Ignavibacteriales bacterium]
MSFPLLLVIVGPTASGKTALSILLAEKLGGEIISADSRQIYRYLDIGTAKPTSEELQRVGHQFINILNPDQYYNAGEYGQQARAKIEELLKQNKQPILVGGSGLYVRAVIDGFFEGPGKNSDIREQLETEVHALGPEKLFERLKKIDPVSAGKMDATKVRRVIRALEVYYTTGKPISDLHSIQEAKNSFEAVQFGLQWERKALYHRIERRVDEMIENGLIEEVRGLLEKGYSRGANALNTVGYKEVFDFFEGKITKEEMTRLIKQNTRHFAKRQLTWFRADKRIQWIPLNDETNWNVIAEHIQKDFQSAHQDPSSPN